MNGEKAHSPKNRLSLAGGLGFAVIAGGVWLAFEVAKGPVVDRAQPALAMRLAPTSPEVLRRAAEAELAAGRTQNALELSTEALARAPFNARALRVRGLSEASLGEAGRADAMLTLAGNWSLRDDPTHAWLVEYRLRRGDYVSAFAHADTLARRRSDLWPAIFRLFTAAAVQEPKSLPILTRLLASQPPWRPGYLEYLRKDKAGAPVIGALALGLERTEGPFSTYELQQLYTSWVVEGRLAGIREVRRRLGRPSLTDELQNGDFTTQIDEQFYPFGWRLGSGAGIRGDVMEDDLRPGNTAYRLDYDGFASGVFIEQLTLLAPGEYVLTGDQRAETPLNDMQLSWRIRCAETGGLSNSSAAGAVSATDDRWRRFTVRFSVPPERCSAQWVRLEAEPEDRRTTIAMWVDNLKVQKAPRIAVAPARN